ncbi:MAG: nuclear transport factor 2 family protein [Rhodobacteraceae bacterium]|nr:nuclear transport factor 2 family protein [Paracoccaceae bacterium]
MSVEITNSVSRFFASVDRCDWPAVQALMTEQFHVDYSSYGGGPASEVSPEGLTAAWAGFLPYFDSVHHQIGNLIVEQNGDTAEVRCHGMASHFIAEHPGGDLQFVVGTYDLELKRDGADWKLSSMRFNFKYASGNQTLAAEAQRRAAEANSETSNA